MKSRANAELLSGPARHDWSARARINTAELLRYSRFVGVMKRTLPVAAFAVIAAVLAFFFVQRQPQRLQLAYERLGHIENDLAMIHPRLSGADAKGNPFVITADAAVQDAANLKHARLKNIQADLVLDNKGWLDATATAGEVDMRAGKLNLNGGLSLFSDSGYELHTARADVDLNAGIVRGPQPVTGHGPLGTLRADRFEVDRELGRLVLAGNVHMVFTQRSRT